MAQLISSRPVLVAALLLGAPGALTLAPIPAARAQEGATTRVDPYVVVFTAGEVPVRAGNSTIYYPIVFPKPGDALVVDAETAGWLRVKYPANVRALVSADEAQESGGKVRLTKASKLRAPNANSGIKGAFLGVQDTELPIGSEFKVLDTIKDDSGKVIAYAVEPPSGARGWISREAVRRATDSEAAPVLAKLAAAAPAPAAPSTPKADTPTPSAPTANTPADTTPPSGAAAAQPANPPIEPVKTPDPAATPAHEPVHTPAGPPVTPAPSTPIAPAPTIVTPPPAVIPTTTDTKPVAPVSTPPGMEIPGAVPIGDKDGGNGSITRMAPPAAANSLDALKELYNNVRNQPAASAELDPTIAAFEQFKRGLSASARDQALAKQLDAYIAALKMRKDLRDLQNANATVNRETELMKSDVGKRVIELEKQRVYNVIGRLVRSTVYDGGRAPVLYRVMSPEPGSARTLGYLLPDPNFDYANKLEQVVGIIGEIRPDESLRTNLIVPKRVDVVSLAPIVVSPDIPGLVVPRGGQAPSAPTPAPARPPSEMPKLPSTPPPAVTPGRPAMTEPEKP